MRRPSLDATIEQKILELAAARGPGKTICPSEVARALADDWHPLMDRVRYAVNRLDNTGAIIVKQKSKIVTAHAARGPIRIAPT